jgi:Flp pilus assembly protein TadG
MTGAAMRLYSDRRRGATVLECAIVYPVTFLLLLGILIGGMGVFRYQEVASIAREASRWASVHGKQYATETGKPAATATDVYNNVIVPKAVSLDLSRLTYSVTWNKDNNPYYTQIVNGNVVPVTNTVASREHAVRQCPTSKTLKRFERFACSRIWLIYEPGNEMLPGSGVEPPSERMRPACRCDAPS